MRTAQMRYVGQTYEVDADIPAGTLTDKHIPQIAQVFHEAHRREYGVSSDAFPIAFVALGITAIGKLKEPPLFNFASEATGGQGSTRKVYFNGEWLESKLYSHTDITRGSVVSGPGIIEYRDSIAVLPPACSGVVDNNGNLIVTIN